MYPKIDDQQFQALYDEADAETTLTREIRIVRGKISVLLNKVEVPNKSDDDKLLLSTLATLARLIHVQTAITKGNGDLDINQARNRAGTMVIERAEAEARRLDLEGE